MRSKGLRGGRPHREQSSFGCIRRLAGSQGHKTNNIQLSCAWLRGSVCVRVHPCESVQSQADLGRRGAVFRGDPCPEETPASLLRSLPRTKPAAVRVSRQAQVCGNRPLVVGRRFGADHQHVLGRWPHVLFILGSWPEVSAALLGPRLLFDERFKL